MWLPTAAPFTGILLLFQLVTAHTTPPPPQYHLLTQARTWAQARTFCRVKHGDLATVHNMADARRLASAVVARGGSFWIGLRRGGGAGRWAWSDGRGPAHFTRWKEGRPDEGAGDERCGEFAATETWSDVSCSQTKGVVCYDRQGDGKETYKYHSAERSWVDGQELCRDRHHDMAAIDGQTANADVAALVKTWTSLILLPNKVWFGLFRDRWTWSDGSHTSFRYWLRGSPMRGDCAAAAAAAAQGRWVEAQCDHKSPFVCQGGLKVKTMVVRLTLRFHSDLDSATVRNAVLQKVELLLKQQHLADFNLSLRSDNNGVFFQRLKPEEVANASGR